MHSVAHPHTAAPPTTGLVMNWGWRYDLVVWLADKLAYRGALGRLQQRAIELANPVPGEAVLDVGCGTGALALLAKRRLGDRGRVVGIDPGEKQLVRARARAARRGLDIELQLGVIENLPFPDHTFDVVVSSLMMHHLPDDVKRRGLAEVARVLAPSGRLVIVDFKRGHHAKSGRFGAGQLDIAGLPELVREAGFADVTTGELATPRVPGLGGVGWVAARTS